LPLVLGMALLLLGKGEWDGDLDGEESLDLLLGGLLSSSLVQLVTVGDLSLFLPLLPGLWSAEAFLGEEAQVSQDDNMSSRGLVPDLLQAHGDGQVLVPVRV
jgi:hypothetical protein